MGSLSQLPQGFGGTCRRDSNTHRSASHASEDPKPSSCREYHWQTSFSLSLSLNGSSNPDIQLCQCCWWGYWLPATITNVVKLDSKERIYGRKEELSLKTSAIPHPPLCRCAQVCISNVPAKSSPDLCLWWDSSWCHCHPCIDLSQTTLLLSQIISPSWTFDMTSR